MKIPIQLFYSRLLLALLGGLFCSLLYWNDWVQPLDRSIYDTFNEMATLPTADDIVIVAVDEPSLAELGRWPWPRENHVELLRRLKTAGVAAVAVDILFAEPYLDYPEVDGLLGDAIEELGSVVLPVFVGRTGPSTQLREIGPIEPLASAAASRGHVHVEVDSDGVARGVYLMEGLGAPRWPHFSVALAKVLGLEVEPLPGISDHDILANPSPNAIIRSHATLIPFMGGAGTVNQVPYVEVMKGRTPAAQLRDKIVFVGATAAGHVDNITTSWGQIAGVEVNANIFHALRSGKLAQAIPTAPLAIFSFVLVAFSLFVITRLEPGRLLLIVLAAAVLLLLTSFLLLHSENLWISPAPVLLTLFITYPLWNWLRLATAMDFIRGQLLQLDKENRQSIFRATEGSSLGNGNTDPVDEILKQLDRAYREAQQNHELVRGTLVQLASGVILAEPNGHILMMNDEANNLLGRPGLRGQIHKALADVELEKGVLLKDLLDALETEQDHFNCEGYALASQRDLLLHGGVIGLDHPLLLLVLTDVSELKQSEKQRAEALNFLSHDLRAPLTSVLALIESAKEDTGASLGHGLLGEIERYIKANLSYAENFIQLAKLEQTALPRFDECDAQSLLDNAVAQLYHSAASRGITMRLSGGDEELWLNCSRDLIERLLINLLDNALKHSSNGDTVDLGLTRDGDWAQFTVSDQGTGIDPVDLQRIFDQFQQGTHARSGAGLGLRFVQAVTLAHSGTISASNNTSGGSCFLLRLPLPH